MKRVIGHGVLMDPQDMWDSTGRRIMLYTEVGRVLAMSDGARHLKRKTEPKYTLTTVRDPATGRYHTRDMNLSPLTPGQLARLKRALGGGAAAHPDIHFVAEPTKLSELAAGALKDAGSLYLVACAPELDDDEPMALETDEYDQDRTRWLHLQMRRRTSLASAAEYMEAMLADDLHAICTGDHDAEAIRQEWKVSRAATVTDDPASWDETLEILLAGGKEEAVKLLKVWERNDQGFPEYGREPLERLALIAKSKRCRSDVEEVWCEFSRQMMQPRAQKRRRKEPPLPARKTKDDRPYKRPSASAASFAKPKKDETHSPEEAAFLLDTIRTGHHLNGGRAAASPVPTWDECLAFLKEAYPPDAVPAYLAPSVQQQALGVPTAWQVTLDVDWDQIGIEQEGFDPHLLGYKAVLVHREGSEVKKTPCLLKVMWNDVSGYTPYLEMPQ